MKKLILILVFILAPEITLQSPAQTIYHSNEYRVVGPIEGQENAYQLANGKALYLFAGTAVGEGWIAFQPHPRINLFHSDESYSVMDLNLFKLALRKTSPDHPLTFITASHFNHHQFRYDYVIVTSIP